MLYNVNSVNSHKSNILMLSRNGSTYTYNILFAHRKLRQCLMNSSYVAHLLEQAISQRQITNTMWEPPTCPLSVTSQSRRQSCSLWSTTMGASKCGGGEWGDRRTGPQRGGGTGPASLTISCGPASPTHGYSPPSGISTVTHPTWPWSRQKRN